MVVPVRKTFTYPLDVKDAVIHDGDTITHVHLILEPTVVPDRDLGFNLHALEGNLLLTKQSIRLTGIDTPEMKGKTKRERALAVAARDWLSRQLLAPGATVHVESVEHPDKYGRILGRIHVTAVDGSTFCVNDRMVELGFAHRYDGGTKQRW